jgi:hypothetical protein
MGIEQEAEKNGVPSDLKRAPCSLLLYLTSGEKGALCAGIDIRLLDTTCGVANLAYNPDVRSVIQRP